MFEPGERAQDEGKSRFAGLARIIETGKRQEKKSMGEFKKERLTTPMIRENGNHRPASWDEALDRVASEFRGQIAQHGPRTFGMFSCSKTTNELNYVAQKFVRTVIGTNNIDSCNRT